MAPPILITIMRIVNSGTAMGDQANGRAANLLGWGTTVAMFGAAIALVFTWFQS